MQDGISPGANLLTSVEILVSGVCFLNFFCAKSLLGAIEYILLYLQKNTQLCSHLTYILCVDGNISVINIGDLGLSCY